MVYLFVYWCWDNIGACFNKTTRGCVIVLDPTQNLTMENDGNVKINDSQWGYDGSNFLRKQWINWTQYRCLWFTW